MMWDEMQKSFRNIRGFKVNNSLSDKNRFIRENGQKYRKNMKQNEAHAIEKQIIEKLKLKKESQQKSQENFIGESKMPYQAAVYRIFIASPNDVADEREIVTKVIDDWNAINSVSKSIVLLPIRWETHSYPQTGAHPQKIINKQILQDADFLIGIFWSRFGTPTDDYPSATEEEISEHIKAGKPAMLYFSKKPLPHNVDVDQLHQLRAFKDEYSKKSLFHEYDSIEDFRHAVYNHISMKMNEVHTPQLQTPQKNDIVVLSEEAEKMLMTANVKNCPIINIAHQGGHAIGPNGFTNTTLDRRMVATLKAALEELENKGFISATGDSREIFEITDAGYKWCDSKSGKQQ